MAVVGAPLVLLDIQDEHEGFHEHLEAELFSRFTDADGWVNYILDNLNIRLHHLFLPDVERGLIDTAIPLFGNRIFYVSCANQQNMMEVENTHNHPMFVKAFLTELFPTFLYRAAVECLTDAITRIIDDPRREDMLQQAVFHILRLMGEEAVNHMNDQMAVEAEDRR